MNIAQATHWAALVLAMLASVGFWHPAAAAGPVEEATGQASSDAAQDRRRLVADNLPLTPSEAQRFWPIYERFQKEMSTILGRRQEIIVKLGENYDNMSDEVARQITVETLELQQTRLKMTSAYLAKFEKVLPARKLARYFQIEGRIRAAVDAEIAERIPLIK